MCIGDNPGGQLFQGLLLTTQRRGGGECGGPRTTWWHAPTSAPSAALEEGKLTEKQLGLGAPSRGRERRVKASQHGRIPSVGTKSTNRDGRAGNDQAALLLRRPGAKADPRGYV